MGRYVDPRAGKITFATYASAWQASQVHRRNTALAVDSALRVHYLPRFGSRPIASIRSSEVQTFVKGLSETLRPASVKTVLQHLRAVFKAAETDRVIAGNPCQGITLPRVERVHVTPMETRLVWAIHDAMPAHLRAMITLLATTGLRPGEAAGVTGPQINFLQRQLHVDRQLLRVSPAEFGPVKTASSVRTIPLPTVTLNELACHLELFPLGGEATVFSRPDGRPLHRDWVSKAFASAVNRVGGPPATRMHDLRHYYASV